MSYGTFIVALENKIKELEASLLAITREKDVQETLADLRSGIIRGLEADKMELKAKIGTLTDAQLEGAKVRYADPNLIGGVNVEVCGERSESAIE